MKETESQKLHKFELSDEFDDSTTVHRQLK